MNSTIAKNFAKCGIAGIGLECLYTGLKNTFYNKERRLLCNTSLWMFPIYGSACIFNLVHKLIKGFSYPIRGMMYAICIFTGEYLSGTILRRFNACPWDYTGKRTNINGLIRLDYAPFWCIAGLLFEKISNSSKK